MKTTDYREEALTSIMMVASLLDTGRMVGGALATTSTYTVVVFSRWGRNT
jgi:hypothetical protein